MRFIEKILLIASLTFSAAVFSGCQGNAENEIRVGTIAGPETELMKVASEVALKEHGLKIKIVEFTDYTLPNTALNDGSIDANVFQHQPYLDASIKNRQYDLVSVGKTFIYPMGIYSKKIAKLSDIPMDATVAIPNDPSNEARALLLLQNAKLIALKVGADVNATPKDIIKNPKNIQFREIDAAQLPRVLQDVTAAAINTNYAIPAGLLPKRDALFIENVKSPYANLIVVKNKDKTNAKIMQLISVLHSTAVLKKAQELFQGQAIPAWQ